MSCYHLTFHSSSSRLFFFNPTPPTVIYTLSLHDALPIFEVIGIGTNLTCMYGVLPSEDKLLQLCLYKQLVEAKFNQEIPYISGGASVTIPLIYYGLIPDAVNHIIVSEISSIVTYV